jgi:hypothetical protein
MPDIPIVKPPKTAGPVIAWNRTASGESILPDTAVLVRNSLKRSPLTVGLGALSAALIIIVYILWNRVGSRDTTIVENRNHADQVQAGSVVLQAQIDAAKAGTVRLQKQWDETKADLIQLEVQLAESRALAAELKTKLGQAEKDVALLQKPLAKR